MYSCARCEKGIVQRFQVMADPKKNGRIRYFVRRCPASSSVGYCKPCANAIKAEQHPWQADSVEGHPDTD